MLTDGAVARQRLVCPAPEILQGDVLAGGDSGRMIAYAARRRRRLVTPRGDALAQRSRTMFRPFAPSLARMREM